MSSTAGTAALKGKTKAKQRYLRRKKERRKQKKVGPSAPKSARGSGEDEDEDADESEDGSERDDDVVMADREGGAEEISQKETDKEKPPKKRKKVVDVVEDVVMQDERPDEDDQRAEHLDITRPKSPPAALPRFPLPSIPNAPSKAELALLGLDKGLVDAQLIDPGLLLPIPSGDLDPATHLGERMKRRLADLGINELFAVQTVLLPFLLPLKPSERALYLPFNPPRDVCVSAPTGSGKTLAYALPIIELLTTRVVTRLRALIVLPTRDLVIQVRETFEALAKGRGLQIGTATGQHSFAHEQSQLVADLSADLVGGSSKVDILICTPGRLIDHLSGTRNFSLQHLRFLVIDEADRLLAQSFQDWLAHVLAATRPPKIEKDQFNPSLKSIHSLSDAVAPAFSHLLPYPDIPTFYTERKEASCQKLLFSATLTRDPGKIAALELRNPKYFIVQGSGKGGDESSGVMNVIMEKFTMPSTLTERMIVCEASQKPLVFYHLVLAHNVVNALVFTKSAESTTRLVRLFDFLEKARHSTEDHDQASIIRVRAYSSDLAVGERKAILEQFKGQEIQILVCSDLISRGIDISHVSHVVSYDVPVDMRKYVHRVGRTARAGRQGDAWSLVEEQEARYFKNMLKEVDHLEKVKRLRIGEKELSPLQPYYQTALDSLKEAYAR